MKPSDIEGYDKGMIHSQRAEFQVFYHTLKNHWSNIMIATTED